MNKYSLIAWLLELIMLVGPGFICNAMNNEFFLCMYLKWNETDLAILWFTQTKNLP